MFAAIIIITLLILIVILLMMRQQREPVRQEPNVYIIGSGREEWPASYWNWFSSQYNWEPNAMRFGGYGDWGSQPHHHWTAGPGYKPAGHYEPHHRFTGIHTRPHH